MKFLNYFSVFCCKTFSFSVEVQCKNLHKFVLWRNLSQIKLLKQHKTKYFFRENYAQIHCSVGMYAKSYRETENEYAHEVMLQIPSYSKTTVKQPFSVNMEDYTDCEKELNEFAKVTMHCMSVNINLEDGPFSLPVSNLIGCLPNLSNDNLLRCLFLLCCLPPAPKTWTPNFKALWNSLDLECVRRLPIWDTSQKLLVADYWFHLRLNRISQYNRNMIEDLLKRLDELTDAEVVQLLFCINLQREVPPESLRDIEARLFHVAKTVSIEELGIVCLGFFKTQNKSSDISIIKVIIERFVREIEVAKFATLVSLLKFLKKSMNLSYTELYIPLLHKSASYVCKWDVPTCIHLALLASECHVYHPLLLDSVTERVHALIESARLKDLMKLLQCLSHFNHQPPQKFNSSLFSELQKETRQPEISKQPRILIYIALYYSYMGHYNYNLLNVVLEKKFAWKCIATFPETRLTFAEVDCSTEIECRDYTGSRLGKNFWKVLEERRGSIDMADPKNTSARIMRDILSAFSSKENIEVRHLLPHTFLPDILVRPSSNKIPFSSNEASLFLPPKEEMWICLVIGVPYSFTYRSRHKTGVTAMKIRQLEILSYKTIFIPYYELPRDIEKRKKYLEERLRSINNCHYSYLISK